MSFTDSGSWYRGAYPENAMSPWLLLAFYRNSFLHGLLPLSTVSRWIVNLVYFTGSGILSACAALKRRHGLRAIVPHAFMILTGVTFRVELSDPAEDIARIFFALCMISLSFVDTFIRASNWRRIGMDKRLLRFLPPGTGLKQTENFIAGMFSASASWNLMMFIIRYYFALDGLYVNQIWRRVLIPDAKIEDFSVLLRGGLVAYVICLSLCVLLAVNYYWSFHAGSVSAYVMRRIPDAKELHIRCLTVPVCAALLMTALIILLLFIERAVYIAFTPAGCLGDTSIDIFRILSMKV